MPANGVFSTANAKGNGAGRWGGEIWLHSFLTLTIYGSGQNHTWSLYAWLNSPHYPLNARLRGPRIWNERFREKLNRLPFSGSNPEFLGCPTHSVLTQQTLLYCFISHSSNHFYLNRNKQQPFLFSLFAKADRQVVEIFHHIKKITYKNATKVEKPHQIKQATNKNIKRVKGLTRLRISRKSRE